MNSKQLSPRRIINCDAITLINPTIAPTPSRVSKTIPSTQGENLQAKYATIFHGYRKRYPALQEIHTILGYRKRHPIIGSGITPQRKPPCPRGYRKRYPATKIEHTFTPINSLAAWYRDTRRVVGLLGFAPNGRLIGLNRRRTYGA